MWDHKERFRTEVGNLVRVVENKGPPQPPVEEEIELSQDLFIEFDEFLVQLKSTLDHLVKVPVPIFGANRWNLRTFRKRGEGVIKALGSVPSWAS